MVGGVFYCSDDDEGSDDSMNPDYCEDYTEEYEDREDDASSSEDEAFEEDDFESGKKHCSTVKSLHRAIQEDFEELIQEVKRRCGSKGYDDHWLPNPRQPPPDTETAEVRDAILTEV